MGYCTFIEARPRPLPPPEGEVSPRRPGCQRVYSREVFAQLACFLPPCCRRRLMSRVYRRSLQKGDKWRVIAPPKRLVPVGWIILTGMTLES